MDEDSKAGDALVAPGVLSSALIDRMSAPNVIGAVGCALRCPKTHSHFGEVMRHAIVLSFFTVIGCGDNGTGPGPSGTNVITPAGVTLVLAGGAVTLEAPAGAVSQNVSIEASVRQSGGPSDPTLVRGAEYVLTATPAVTFSKPVRLTLNYDPASGPIGVKERELGIAIVNGSEWTSITGGTVDEAANKVTTPVSQLGVFAVHRVPQTVVCNTAESRQFDFWLGEWTVTGVHSSITRDESGCTIFELYRAPMTGRSISFYDPETAMWYQTYVSAGGAQPLKMSGRVEDGRMIMYVRTPNGNLSSRWTWERIDANTVIQKSEATADNGVTFSPVFTGTYTRR